MYSKYTWRVYIDPNNPLPSAKDDQLGLICMHKDLRRQMEYGPNGLYDTGRRVHKDYIDQPNPQGIQLILPPDPAPIIEPRPFQFNPGDPSDTPFPDPMEGQQVPYAEE